MQTKNERLNEAIQKIDGLYNDGLISNSSYFFVRSRLEKEIET